MVLPVTEDIILRPLTLRAPDRNPLSSKCPLHLRRVCGVCAHFQGALKGGKPAPCAALLITRDPCTKADRCHRFERRGVAHE